MNDDALIYAYFFVGGALFLLVLLGLVASCVFPGLNKRSRHFFIPSFSLLALGIAAYVVDLFIYTDPSLAWVGRIVSFIETFFPSVLMPLLTAYISHCCGKRLRESPAFYIAVSLCASLFVLLLITQFTDAIYYFTDDNRFVTGPWYWVLIVPLMALILLNIIQVILERNKIGKRYFIAFLIYLLPILVAMAVQAFVSVFLLIVIAVSISALSMFGIIVADHMGKHLAQQKEIADQRVSITVLQMRPHFIYNTMTSIYYLCEQDAAKAQKVTLDFTTYLRKNFNAITSKDPVTFTEELEHTRAYLSVVQAQFEDNLAVEFDVPHTLFRLPPLTLQPLVENAVKYGMDVDSSEPLRVSVKTQKAEKGSLLIVADNGPGLSVDDNGEPHIALNNIRERLTAIGASLSISSNENGGTTITVFIPDGKSN